MSIWRFRRGSPWDEFDRLRREMDDLMGALSPVGGPRTRSPWSETRLFPPLNVEEQADSYVVTAEIPGMKKEDLEIRMEGDTLTLKGERKPEPTDGEVSYHRRERATGRFQRSLTLPGVDPDKVNAVYKHGVLSVTLGKQKAAGPRRITVETV